MKLFGTQNKSKGTIIPPEIKSKLEYSIYCPMLLYHKKYPRTIYNHYKLMEGCKRYLIDEIL